MSNYICFVTLRTKKTTYQRFDYKQYIALLYVPEGPFLSNRIVVDRNVSILFLDPEGGSQKATVVVVVVVAAAVAVVVVVLLLVISSLKIPKSFLIRSGTQRDFAHTFVLTLPTDVPSQIFKLISN